MDKKKLILILFFIFPMFIVLLDFLFPLPQMKSFSKEIYAKDGTLLTAYLTEDDKWRMFTKLKEITPKLRKAIIEKEDRWFYIHPGINPISMVKALYINVTNGERVSGASTITMQLARLLEPKERTYINKFAEIFRAIQLELRYTKDEILEMYLSLLPYGGNIEGVKAASYIYFNRAPGKLSLAQSIMLAVIPNNPNGLRIDTKVEGALAHRNFRIKKFIEDEVFNKNDLKSAIEEPLKPNRFKVPSIAPHFCNYVSQSAFSGFGSERINTSLDLSIQTKAEDLLWNYIQRVYPKGVTNGAVLVIDNKTMSVAAYCGSADFYNKEASGQVDGVRGVRSPGSTLKPFLYAEAFNSGKYTPKMKLLDVPTDFGGYQPENFDLKFNGEVTAAYALGNSLNVPAARLLQEVGLKDFLSLLEKGGFTEISSTKDKLGISMILGGCGVTLAQLTRFYTVFANSGKLYPLNYLKGEKKKSEDEIQIFSESTAYILSEILSNLKRPDIPQDYVGSTRLPKVAWKTGTSYGKRDAWAIGFNPSYTIGVWMGNFDGKGSPYLSGAEMSVPLLFDLFNSIDYDNKIKWFSKPDDLLERKVCAETGLLPTKFCSGFTNDFYINKVSHSLYCNFHEEVYVNKDSTIEYCPGCLPSENFIKAVYPFFQPELEMWFKENGIEYKKHPPHNSNCEIRFTGKGPVIISPSENYEYLVEKNVREEILLKAAPGAGIRTHYWYINNKFYRKSSPGDNIFFKPSEGKYLITCLDDLGRDESIEIEVKYY
jgi:penicillin-binding protein 1C